MTYLERAQKMYQMIGEGNMLEAFETYYHDDVVMVEATGDKREGKDANREFEKNWLAGIKEMHGGGVNAITSNEDAGVTMVEAWTDMTFKDGNRMKMEEVAVQKWDGDKIIHERFYYNA
jgi:ketosteroid isomerase-like protein